MIHYLRDDVSGPKQSLYTVVPTSTLREPRKLLADALGCGVLGLEGNARDRGSGHQR